MAPPPPSISSVSTAVRAEAGASASTPKNAAAVIPASAPVEVEAPAQASAPVQAPAPGEPAARLSGWSLLGLAALVVGLQFPARLDTAAVSAGLALAALAWLHPRAIRRIYLSRFFGITALVAALTGALLTPATHTLGPLPVSGAGARLAALLVLRAAALLALGALLSRALTTARLTRIAARIGLPALGEAVARALSLVPEFLEHGRVLARRLRGGRAVEGRETGGLTALAAALLVRATRVAEGEGAPADPESSVGAASAPPPEASEPS
jgi:energy-coupling factor transporter transmembrane protein EcfT